MKINPLRIMTLGLAGLVATGLMAFQQSATASSDQTILKRDEDAADVVLTDDDDDDDTNRLARDTNTNTNSRVRQQWGRVPHGGPQRSRRQPQWPAGEGLDRRQHQHAQAGLVAEPDQ